MKEIEKIIKAYGGIDWQKEKAALGTVVKVEESAYRRIGARIFISSSGNWTGGISGGCLEGDALRRAQMAINKNQSSIVVYDTLDDDSHQIGVGLGCNGRIEVLFTPINPDDANNPIAFLQSITSTRHTEVLLQILGNSSGTENLIGSFYPAHRSGQLSDAINIAGATINSCITEAIKSHKSKVFELENLQGQHFEILVELIRPKIKLICIGDNYDVNAFAGIARELGWEVHIAGKLRKLGKALFDLANSVCAFEDATDIPLDRHTAVVLMSHDYKTDFQLLQHFLKKKVPYIGLLGPRNRMLKMQTDLNVMGIDIDLNTQPNLFSPVGLDIGAESPEEIALAITAEVIAVLRDRDGGFLRRREGPIHERGI